MIALRETVSTTHVLIIKCLYLPYDVDMQRLYQYEI